MNDYFEFQVIRMLYGKEVVLRDAEDKNDIESSNGLPSFYYWTSPAKAAV